MKIASAMCLQIVALIITISLAMMGCSKSSDLSSDDMKKFELLNVSYDPTREFYSQYNELFCEYWKKIMKKKLILSSHTAALGLRRVL